MPLRSDTLLYGLAVTAFAGAMLLRCDSVAHAEASTPAYCSMLLRPGARDSLTATLLGRATHDTIEAGWGTVQHSIWLRPRRAIYGQVVRVDSMLGRDADRVRRALAARRSTEVLVVPWDYGMGCGLELWQRSALWTTPDSTGLFSLRLRPESLWVAGRPTLDAFFASVDSYADGPYTVGPHYVFNGPTGARVETPSMSAAEFFELIHVLSGLTQPPDSLAKARVRAWVRAHPRATSFPGSQMLRGWPLDPRR